MIEAHLSLFDLVDAPVLVVRLDEIDEIVHANPAALSLLGPAFTMALPCGLAMFGGTPTARLIRRAFDAGTESRRASRFRVLLTQGEEVRSFLCRPATMSAYPQHVVLTLSETTSDSLGRWTGSGIDILQALPFGVEIYDEALNAVFFNKASDDLFAYPDAMISHYDDWWEYGFPDPEARASAMREWREAFDAARQIVNTAHVTEWAVRCRDGVTRALQFRTLWTGEFFLLLFWDVSLQRQSEAELRRLAACDPLTGLWNRRRFLEEAREAFASETSGRLSLAVMMIDIDHFKAINDTYGHDAGDVIIQTVGCRCRDVLHETQSIARWGGEEFVVLLPRTTDAAAARTAEQLRRVVSEVTVLADGRAVATNVSIGVTLRHPGDRDVADMLARADRALYSAKERGRNRVVMDSWRLPSARMVQDALGAAQ